MKTKTLLLSTGIVIMIILMATFFTNAQIPLQGLNSYHEGGIAWDADGTGLEREGYGHADPFGMGSSFYYAASIDYDDIDPNNDAALCHFMENMKGFPMFEHMLASYGFLPEQIKLKISCMNANNDLEGQDWFSIRNRHKFNKYDGYYSIEIMGQPMISGYLNFVFFSYDKSVNNNWQWESNFTKPINVSSNSPIEVQNLAAAFLKDMDGQELRMVITNMRSTGISFKGNGRNGVFFDLVSGYLEKGLPELQFTGRSANHEGLACWDADGTGPEQSKKGHTVYYGGLSYQYSYYYASRDYDGIDHDPNAALCHFIDEIKGFPNLEMQLEYRGYTIDQLKAKTSISTLGDDIRGVDWGLDGSIHWWKSYGNTVTLEIAGEPILEYLIDVNYSSQDLANMSENWESYTSDLSVVDISSGTSSRAKFVAMSLLKDLGGHKLNTSMEGHFSNRYFKGNGRDGVFHEISGGTMTAKLPAGTHIWENEVSGIWDLAGSPYIIMDKIIVPDGKVLEIEKGVVVKFNTTRAFDIYGCIIAEGSEEHPILFTAYNESIPWGGIAIPDIAITNEPISLKHCIFEYSYAYNPDNLYGYNCGGAIRIDDYEQIEISHCVFRYNKADNFLRNNPAGGAIMLNKSSIHISHCIFHDNSSAWGGAIAVLDNSNPVIDNCLFYNNKSTFVAGGGGAVLSWEKSNPYYVNCTFADNWAADAGGAAEIELGGTSTFTNCIFWKNTADNGPNQISVWDPENSKLNVLFSDVQAGLAGITPGFSGGYVGNIDDDPHFINFEGRLYVPDPSYVPECINRGTLNSAFLPNDWVCPLYCLCGNFRVVGPGIDMGCYESDVISSLEKKMEDNTSVRIFPSPINSNPTIEIYLDKDVIVHFCVLDLHGRVISEMNPLQLQKGKNQFKWNAESMAPGIYFCRLQIENKAITKKIIKLK